MILVARKPYDRFNDWKFLLCVNKTLKTLKR